MMVLRQKFGQNDGFSWNIDICAWKCVGIMKTISLVCTITILSSIIIHLEARSLDRFSVFTFHERFSYKIDRWRSNLHFRRLIMIATAQFGRRLDSRTCKWCSCPVSCNICSSRLI